MTGTPITAVVVAFQNEDTIADTLEAAERCHAEGLLDCVVVDNASSDGTVDRVRRDHAWARLVASEENLGFGRGCNLGFEHVETPYVLFLNADAGLEPDSLRRLLEFLEQHPAAGVAAPAFEPTGGVLHAYRRLPTPWSLIRNALPRPFYGDDSGKMAPGAEPFRVEWVAGAALLVQSELFRELGGFDPRFFLYFEETDLLKRVRDSGREVWAVCEAVGRHVGQASSAKKSSDLLNRSIPKHYYRSRFYYMKKHHGLVGAVAAELIEVLSLALRAAGSRLLLRPGGQLAKRLRGPLFRLPERPARADG